MVETGLGSDSTKGVGFNVNEDDKKKELTEAKLRSVGVGQDAVDATTNKVMTSKISATDLKAVLDAKYGKDVEAMLNNTEGERADAFEKAVVSLDIVAELKRRLEQKKNENKSDIYDQKLRDDLKEDVQLSRNVVRALIKEKEAVDEIMELAMQRQQDKWIVFAPVNGLTPKDAAKRVLKLKEEYADVEPVDLTDALDDVVPVSDVYVECIHPIFNVSKPITEQNVPRQIWFVVPPTPSPRQESNVLLRYVNVDSMPRELKDVVSYYISLKNDDNATSRSRFRDAVVNLMKSAEASLDDS